MEFTNDPICTASHKYQKLKITQLQSQHLPETEYKKQLSAVLDKECLCVGLCNAAAINYSQTFVKKQNGVNICPGQNIVNFSKTVSLQTMTDHIYGRKNFLANTNRPHIFIAELHVYINYLKKQLEEHTESEQISLKKKYYAAFYQNLRNGIEYYRQLRGIPDTGRNQFAKVLYYAGIELDFLEYQYTISNN